MDIVFVARMKKEEKTPFTHKGGDIEMIDYGRKFINLAVEISALQHHLGDMIPAYYEQELLEAWEALEKLKNSLEGLCGFKGGGTPYDPYKVDQLMKMLAHETSREEHYGARLHHAAKDTKVLTIDAGGLRALITHYAKHRTDLENGETHPIYRINIAPQEAERQKGFAAFPEDFSHLRPGEDFTAWKAGNDWEIETTLSGAALEERLQKFKKEIEQHG